MIKHIAFSIYAVVGIQLCAFAQDATKEFKTSNRHEFVVHGDHIREMISGDYVVVTTTLTEEDAKKMIQEYKKLKCPLPSYGYLSEKKLWYLYFEGGPDLDSTVSKRNAYRENKMFKDAWLLTVHQ